MTLLILGVVLWSVAHFIKPGLPAQRAAIDIAIGIKPARGVFAALIVASLAMMIIGYRNAEYIGLWDSPAYMTHINNTLMIASVALFGGAHSKGNIKRFVRHPMLLSVVVWSLAHLLVNGDLAALILFGGLLVWAVASIPMINARDGAWVKPPPAPRKKDFILVAITIVVYGIIVTLHALAGVSPFGS
jgi:uncharacterized membrane protein